MSGKKLILTPDEAISLLAEGSTVHNFMQTGLCLIGCGYKRADAEKAIRDAKSIEMGGPASQDMKHPIVVWESERDYSFFEANMERFKEMETQKLAAA